MTRLKTEGGNKIKLALAGNPNSGKSTLFNALTGLNQKVGNYPGVTVDKKTGYFKLTDKEKVFSVELIDLPGSYGLSPDTEDERVTSAVLSDPSNQDHPDIILYVADASNLKRSLHFCTELMDLHIPIILVLNMADLAAKKNIRIDTEKLSNSLDIPVLLINSRKKDNLQELKEMIFRHKTPARPFLPSANGLGLMERQKKIGKVIDGCTQGAGEAGSITDRIDYWLTHRIFGFVIFFGILFFIFQLIFAWAEYPMQWIEEGFMKISSGVALLMPEGALRDLLIEGVLGGLSGIMIFIPQIALLFLFISIFEESGYMARVSFIMDKLMRKFGLNGRSVIPLISGFACAIPAIMSARTIGSRKERLITIMVTPFMSCSARLPVYLLVAGLVIPNERIAGFLNLQGLVVSALYLAGFVVALAVAATMSAILRTGEKSWFIMEMPEYQTPDWKNVAFSIFEKVKVFVLDAGKVIIAISIILWVLSSYAPGDTFKSIESAYSLKLQGGMDTEELNGKMEAEKLQASYAGMIGKWIEPAIAPLGFDWKIGIALVTSFAAREVFVGTMATLYSISDESDMVSIRQKMKAAMNSETGKPVFTVASGISLMLFYAFAMQCMSTLAVVFRETKEWKWPLMQLAGMTILAYLVSLLAYQVMK